MPLILPDTVSDPGHGCDGPSRGSATGVTRQGGPLNDFCPVCEKRVADLDTHDCPKWRNHSSLGPAPKTVSKTDSARGSTSGARQSCGVAETAQRAAVNREIAGSTPAPTATLIEAVPSDDTGPDAGRDAHARERAAPGTLATRKAPQLPTIERVKALLALCLSVDEVKDVRDQAVAYAAYWKQRGDSLEIQNQAAAVRLRAERRIGEMLLSAPKNKGGRPPKTCAETEQVSTLGEVGITRKQAAIWQRIARLAEHDFEDRIATAQENSVELTTFRVLNEAREVAKAAERASKQDEKHATAPPEPTTLPPLKKLARLVVAEHTRAELTQFCAWISGLAAKDEQSPT